MTIYVVVRYREYAEEEDDVLEAAFFNKQKAERFRDEREKQTAPTKDAGGGTFFKVQECPLDEEDAQFEIRDRYEDDI
jgi:hypothetical protein